MICFAVWRENLLTRLSKDTKQSSSSEDTAFCTILDNDCVERQFVGLYFFLVAADFEPAGQLGARLVQTSTDFLFFLFYTGWVVVLPRLDHSISQKMLIKPP